MSRLLHAGSKVDFANQLRQLGKFLFVKMISLSHISLVRRSVLAPDAAEGENGQSEGQTMRREASRRANNTYLSFKDAQKLWRPPSLRPLVLLEAFLGWYVTFPGPLCAGFWTTFVLAKAVTLGGTSWPSLCPDPWLAIF